MELSREGDAQTEGKGRMGGVSNRPTVTHAAIDRPGTTSPRTRYEINNNNKTH